ncbi:MAG: hypothetical protein ACK5CY_04610 [Bacteroidia bacterium]|jgi:hypothetical protein
MHLKGMVFRRIIFIYSISISGLYGQMGLSESARAMLNDSDAEKRMEFGRKVETLIDSVLSLPQSSFNGLDTIRSISVLRAPDNTFLLITWNIPQLDGTYKYYGRVRFADSKKARGKTLVLIDDSDSISKPEFRALNAAHWYGALYYKIIYTKYKRKKTYTLLGWDGNTALSNRKIIDVMQITGKNVKFGSPIFQEGKILKHRVLLEYAEDAAVSLRYFETNQHIVFDHLVPPNSTLEGQYAFYSPDFSTDAYVFEKGKWKFIRNFEARNDKEEQKNFKKPEKGLAKPR